MQNGKNALLLMMVAFGIGLMAEEPVQPEATRVYVNEGEELLVHLQQHEGLLRRQIYREASIQAVARKERYERDIVRAQKSLTAFKTELDTLEKAKDVNITRLETVLNGIGEAEKIINICMEGVLVVDTAIEQMAKHRGLILKTRARVRKSLGATPDQCGLHRIKMEPVRVPVIAADSPGAKAIAASADSPTSIVLRIRQFPCPAEAFVTDDKITERTPKHIVIPACSTCTANHQAWLKKQAATSAP